ncbi:hypothetical protein [Yersinia pestis]|uniref:hypothetical protein n=1 Tax=Yersinia pestis TaxID=632 RepID=UPI0006276559|nr:hypothetical protein [Yersinia pestis]KKM56798.1 hypothetical protein VT69_12720 [Yersinia pestis]
MKNKIFTAIVLLFSFSLSIQAIANKKNDKKIIINNLTISSTWVRTAISESIDSPSNTINKDDIKRMAAGKHIYIMDNKITIEGVCTFKYVIKKSSPLNYWHSDKTVNLYKEEFLKNGFKLSENLAFISAEDPSNDCDSPYFQIAITDNVIFTVYNGHIVFYTNSNNVNELAL